MLYSCSWDDNMYSLKPGRIITRSAFTASGKAKVYNLASDTVEERNFKDIKIASKESVKEIDVYFDNLPDIKLLKLLNVNVSQDIYAMPIEVFMKAAKKLDK